MSPLHAGARARARGRAFPAQIRHSRAPGRLPQEREGTPAQLPGAEGPNDRRSPSEVHSEARHATLELLNFAAFYAWFFCRFGCAR